MPLTFFSREYRAGNTSPSHRDGTSDLVSLSRHSRIGEFRSAIQTRVRIGRDDGAGRSGGDGTRQAGPSALDNRAVNLRCLASRREINAAFASEESAALSDRLSLF